jgi:BMFP domain-containing protein YqiC
MIDPKVFDDMAKKFTDSLPPVLGQFKTEMQQNFKAALQGTFAKLNLVTREEFDIQAQLLAKAQAQLELLSQQVKELEAERDKQ